MKYAIDITLSNNITFYIEASDAGDARKKAHEKIQNDGLDADYDDYEINRIEEERT